MKTLMCVVILWFVFLVVGASSVRSEYQEVDGYTFLRGQSGGVVCLGTWIPSTDVALPGVCDGQLVDVAQLTAVSTRLSADRLDQLLFAMTAIDQRLAASNAQLERLIEVTVNTQNSIEQQVRQGGEMLADTISRRFDELPKEILANDLFREELTKLKEDILKEVDRRYSRRPVPSKK